MKEPLCVGLLFVHTFAFSRRVLRGIRRYVEAKPQWLLTSFTPNRQLPRVLRRIRPQGLIAGVNTQRLVATVSAFHRPVVNVATVFPDLKFPYVGTDNVQVGRLAAEHFLERGLRHFGFIGSPDYLSSSQREAAFCQAVRAAGFAVACHHGRTHPTYDALGQRWEWTRPSIGGFWRSPGPRACSSQTTCGASRWVKPAAKLASAFLKMSPSWASAMTTCTAS